MKILRIKSERSRRMKEKRKYFCPTVDLFGRYSDVIVMSDAEGTDPDMDDGGFNPLF